MKWWPTSIALLLALPMAAAAEPPSYRKVPALPSATDYKESRGLLERLTGKSKRACLDSASIAGAIVTSDRTVDLVLTGGDRWRMRFKDDCRALSYYQGFYYRPSDGRLCAGQDSIRARSGAECPIASLAKLRRRK